MSSGVEFLKGTPPVRKGAGRGVYSKHLAMRDDKGRFRRVPRKDLEIIIVCGNIRGVNRIVTENQRAIRTGIEKGLVTAMLEMIPGVAKRTGKFRQILIHAAQSVGAVQSTSSGNVITIDINDIKLMAAAIEEYTQYHMNPDSPYGEGYKDPFTPNTKPLDLVELQTRSFTNINREITAAQRSIGLAVR